MKSFRVFSAPGTDEVGAHKLRDYPRNSYRAICAPHGVNALIQRKHTKT